MTLCAGGRGEAAVTLYELLWPDSSERFEVIDVLGILREELVFLLEKGDKAMCGRIGFRRGKDVFCNGIEDAGVVGEDVDIEDLLGV